MRKRIAIFVAAIFVSCAIAGCASSKNARLTTQQVAEVKDWMYSAHTLYNFGDYNLAKYYCEKIMEKYPDTSYARQAKSLSKRAEWKVSYK